LFRFHHGQQPVLPVNIVRKFTFLMFLVSLLAGLPGCSWIISSATSNFAKNLGDSILNQSDPTMVKDGLPSYLILIDAMLEGDPDNESILRAAASLNSSYAGLFLQDPQRQKNLAQKALDYGSKAVCVRDSKACHITTMHFEEFAKVVDSLKKKDVPTFYALGAAWAGWIQANSDDWNAIAQLAQVERIMQRVVALNEAYENGGAHMYLGVLATLIPPGMGGKPDVGREHFERAITLSHGKNLMAKVLFAQHYARLVFDRQLHDKLIKEVLDADPKVPGLTLINTLAQQQAKQLAATADDYF
jgi:hypothetical protein